jgi:Chaperone of endosialidase
MTRTNFRFVETSKLPWHACTVALVLVLMLAKPSGAQTDNTAYGTGALAGNSGSYNSGFGFDALYNNAGGFNTATGYLALYSNTTGSDNTAVGGKALFSNTASYNTATGYGALYSNTSGTSNVADGFKALLSNTTGSTNTADGYEALFSNTGGSANTAEGSYALYSNNGTNNTATGFSALASNAGGSANTATGANALSYITTGNSNTAVGFEALGLIQSGSNNIALGQLAGINLTTTGSNNIDIGNEGIAGDNGAIKIGTQGTQTAAYIAGIYGATAASGIEVYVDSSGQLGTISSSVRFKEEIKPMDDASAAILALKPVTFHYKKELDPRGISQFGLVAEQVAKVDPDLVVRDEKGQVFTVRYEAVNAMLLNEFLKEHQRVQELQTRLDSLAAQMKEQDRAIEDVSKKIENKVPATE